MRDDLKLPYTALNACVFSAIPLTARRVLDVGCGTGALGKMLKLRQKAEVVGITYSEAEALEAREVLDQVKVCDLNSFSTEGCSDYDCIIFSHVLEHLYWPSELLKVMRQALAANGVIIVGLPNTLMWRQRWRFLIGQFRYADYGIMDRTHFRFFDWNSAQELVSNSGFKVVQKLADGNFPFSRFLPLLGPYLDRLALRLAPGFFGRQFVIVGRLA